jgi:hypothetical protein
LDPGIYDQVLRTNQIQTDKNNEVPALFYPHGALFCESKTVQNVPRFGSHRDLFQLKNVTKRGSGSGTLLAAAKQGQQIVAPELIR